MTHHTEAERADFEAAYVAEKLRIIRSEGSADGEKAIRSVMLRRSANGDYDNSLEAHFAWWAWQAARKDIAPQPPEAAKHCDTPNYCQSVQRCTAMDEKRAKAAPVQMQKPFALYDGNRWFADEKAAICACADLAKLQKVYLEQQVRQLLAAQERKPIEVDYTGIEGVNTKLIFMGGWKAAEHAHGIKAAA